MQTTAGERFVRHYFGKVGALQAPCHGVGVDPGAALFGCANVALPPTMRFQAFSLGRFAHPVEGVGLRFFCAGVFEVNSSIACRRAVCWGLGVGGGGCEVVGGGGFFLWEDWRWLGVCRDQMFGKRERELDL